MSCFSRPSPMHSATLTSALRLARREFAYSSALEPFPMPLILDQQSQNVGLRFIILMNSPQRF